MNALYVCALSDYLKIIWGLWEGSKGLVGQTRDSNIPMGSSRRFAWACLSLVEVSQRLNGVIGMLAMSAGKLAGASTSKNLTHGQGQGPLETPYHINLNKS